MKIDEDDRIRLYLTKTRMMIEEHNWIVQGVLPDDDTDNSPLFSYTVGLTAVGMPELFMSSIAVTQAHHAHHILNAVAEQAYAGYAFSDDELVDAAHSVLFKIRGPVDAAEDIGVANSLYDDVVVLQVLWPDTDGRYPDQLGYNQDRFPQRLLKRT